MRQIEEISKAIDEKERGLKALSSETGCLAKRRRRLKWNWIRIHLPGAKSLVAPGRYGLFTHRHLHKLWRA